MVEATSPLPEKEHLGLILNPFSELALGVKIVLEVTKYWGVKKNQIHNPIKIYLFLCLGKTSFSLLCN